MKLTAIGALAGLATGCAGAWTGGAPRPMEAPTDSAESRALVRNGTLKLRGQAFLVTRKGDAKPAAGRLVTLDPMTPYTREWFRRFGTDPARFEDPAPDPRFAAARRTTLADAEGRFRFGRLLPGQYLVRSTVLWEGEDGDSGVKVAVVAATVALDQDNDADVVVHQVYTPDSAAALGITIVSDDELAGRPFTVRSRVSGTSCDPESVDEARQDLRLQAGRKGADAVAHVACKRRGMNLAKNCWSRMVCEGDAVNWM